MSGLWRFHSSPVYEFEDRLVILPLLLTMVAMLEAARDPLQGLSHRLFDGIKLCYLIATKVIRHVSNVLLSTVGYYARFIAENENLGRRSTVLRDINLGYRTTRGTPLNRLLNAVTWYCERW